MPSIWRINILCIPNQCGNCRLGTNIFRIFGTFEAEEEKVEYGIVRQVHSNNILTLNLHEFIDMLRDIAKPGPIAQRLKHIWAPPEWEREPRKQPIEP